MTPSTTDKNEIIALERAFWDAMKAKDGAKAAALCAEDSLVTGVKGVMRIAKPKMAAMTKDGNWTLDSYEFEDVEVSTPAPGVAVIAYTVHQKMTMDGKAQDVRAADSSTWVRGPTGWQCCAHSEAFIQ